MDQKTLELISVILAVAAAVGPIFFGFMVYKMTRMFITREEFTAYRESATRDRQEIRQSLNSINDSILKLLFDSRSGQ